jgi:hypothetical protein
VAFDQTAEGWLGPEGSLAWLGWREAGSRWKRSKEMVTQAQGENLVTWPSYPKGGLAMGSATQPRGHPPLVPAPC